MKSFINRYGSKYFIKKKGAMRFDVMRKPRYSNRSKSIRNFTEEFEALHYIKNEYDLELARIEQEREEERRENLKASIQVIQGELVPWLPSRPIGQLKLVS